ncbi:MAG: DNA polymerase IV, partial [Thiohalomonadales bacterium]
MIVHADMDAFYASVEIRENPSLRELPVAVGGNAKQRGVISAANYIARQYRVHSALPTKLALQRCPALVLLPGRIDLYAEVSKQIHEIFYRYTPLIEPLSLDEAFLDVTQSVKLFGPEHDIGRAIKKDVLQELQLVISVGIASNKFIAKIASDLEKPDGFVFVEPGSEQNFLDPLPISRIWGIGKRSNEKLSALGIHTIKQLRELPRNFLAQQFGKHGTHIEQLANGKDPRRVISEHKAKSISNERTFATDIQDEYVLLGQLSDLTEQVAWRLRDKR